MFCIFWAGVTIHTVYNIKIEIENRNALKRKIIISNSSIINTPITIAIDDKFCDLPFPLFWEKIRLDVSCELSPSKEIRTVCEAPIGPCKQFTQYVKSFLIS